MKRVTIAAINRAWVFAALALILLTVSFGASAEAIRVGAVFSTAQQASQSFLRFYNTGANAGTVAVTLRSEMT